MAKRSVSYDPGKATLARQNADGTWTVPSFRGEAKEYVVNLEFRSCSCPSRQSPCKHVLSVAEQSVFVESVQKAGLCSDEQLEMLLRKYLDDAIISGAIRLVRAERKAAAAPVETPAPIPAPRFEAALDNARARKFAEVAAIAQAEPSEAELRKVFA